MLGGIRDEKSQIRPRPPVCVFGIATYGEHPVSAARNPSVLRPNRSGNAKLKRGVSLVAGYKDGWIWRGRRFGGAAAWREIDREKGTPAPRWHVIGATLPYSRFGYRRESEIIC